MGGRAGALQSLSEMKRLTVEAIQSQKPRDIVIGLFNWQYIENPEMFAMALYNWLKARLVIIDEFEELLQSPNILINQIQATGRAFGDCDDTAMLAASILASAGALVRFRAIEPAPDGSFGHVLTEYRFPRTDTWRVFDLTVPGNLVDTGGESVTMDIIS